MRSWFAPLLAVGVSLCAHAASAAQFSLSWPGSNLNNVVLEATVSVVNGVQVGTVTGFVSGTHYTTPLSDIGVANHVGLSGNSFFVEKQNGSHFTAQGADGVFLTFRAGPQDYNKLGISSAGGRDVLQWGTDNQYPGGYAQITNLSAVPLPEFASSPLAKLAALALMALIALGLVRARRARPSPAVA